MSYPNLNLEARPETDAASNEQLLYFTTPSCSADGRTLIAITDRFNEGATNLACVDRDNGRVEPLTDFDTPPAACYPYFTDGSAGLNKSSPSFHLGSGQLVYVEVCADGTNRVHLACLDMHEHRLIAEFAPGVTIGYTHISGDGLRLLLPCADASLLPVGRLRRHNREIAIHYADHGLVTQMIEIDLLTTVSRVLWEEPGWVTHCQYHPTDPGRVLFNHEWTWPVGLQRIWLARDDGWGATRCREAGRCVGPDRASSALDDISHEIWSADGQWFIYHGYWRAYADNDAPGKGRPLLGRIHSETGQCQELLLPDDVPAGYGHYIPSPVDDRVITDAVLDLDSPDDPRRRKLALLWSDFDHDVVRGVNLCAAGSSWSTQDEHPHPVFTPDGREILFTSDRAGKRAIYGLAVEGVQPSLFGSVAPR